jgi:plastocyanin
MILSLFWRLVLLWLAPTAVVAATHMVGIGDACPPGCFTPQILSIDAGDSVQFYVYQEDVGFTGPHNVVADDGSFRCARGCDGEGGDGTPRGYASSWSFTRTFMRPGVYGYRDEGSGAIGVIVVRGGPAKAIGPDITGLWYEPSRRGEALFIEALSEQRILAGWLTFEARRAGQAWFAGVGHYSGNVATIPDIDKPSGGQWLPDHDPSRVASSRWGSLRITPLGCRHLQVDFESSYGNGSLLLARLTSLAGLDCR